ncbi:MAG: alpha/beta fold hydrolase, partial [Sphingobacteriaceae bacterium]
MKASLKVFLWIMAVAAGMYLSVCAFFYVNQDVMIFPATRLDAGYTFNFPYPFTEYKIKNGRDTLSGILFKAQNTKGLIFYLHGNGGALDSWGEIAPTYTAYNYDLFILDYPGYGKSTGRIFNEEDLLKAVQFAYDTLKTHYQEQDIVIIGYSIGTGPAAWLAAHQHPKQLVLMAPYYSLTDLIRNKYPFLPAFMAKYKLKTHEYV